MFLNMLVNIGVSKYVYNSISRNPEVYVKVLNHVEISVQLVVVNVTVLFHGIISAHTGLVYLEAWRSIRVSS